MNFCGAVIIDTRPNRSNHFSPPLDCSDYRTWLIEKNKAGRIGKYCYGVSQKINQLPAVVKHGGKVFACGPHASAAAEVVENITGVTVEILS